MILDDLLALVGALVGGIITDLAGRAGDIVLSAASHLTAKSPDGLALLFEFAAPRTRYDQCDDEPDGA